MSPTSTPSLPGRSLSPAQTTPAARGGGGQAPTRQAGGEGLAARFGWEGEAKVVYVVVVGIAAMLATLVPQVVMSVWGVGGNGGCECTC